MKRAFTTIFLLVSTGMLMIGADFRTSAQKTVAEIENKHCVGYTIIEAGLGVDCHGDTVKLIKKYGYYELAGRYEKNDSLISTN
jgi:hypothetical protein